MIKDVRVTRKEKLNWYSWEESCDKCKRPIRSHNTLSSSPPNLEEADFCVECLRYLLDEKIPYQEALKKYKNSE